MPIKMIALTSFMGVEGLIKSGHLFEVRDQARANYLENMRYAKRNDKEKAAPYETQTLTPTVTETAKPTHTSVIGPENTQEITPENNKAEISQISTQEAPEAESLPNIPEKDLDGATYTELKAIAKDLKIKGYHVMKQDRLLEAIKEKQSGGINNDN